MLSFRRSIIISLFLMCRLLSLFECCLVTWLLGAAMLSRVVGTGCAYSRKLFFCQSFEASSVDIQ
jgi:hypothetical protein